MRLGDLRTGDLFRMWTSGPLLEVIENKGRTMLVQRQNMEFTRQEVPGDTEVWCEYAKDDPVSLNDALSQSPFKKIREVRVIVPEED